MEKRIKYSRAMKIASFTLSIITVVQAVPVQAFAEELNKDMDNNSKSQNSTNIKWDSVGGKLQGYFIAEYGSEEPYRYIKNSGTINPILKSSDLENGEFILTKPSDWDNIKDKITISDYDSKKMGEQLITLTYTSDEGESASIQAYICVVKKQANPQITDSDIEAVRSTQKVPTKDGQYLLDGFQPNSSHLSTLIRLDILKEKYIEDDKTYVDIGAYSYVIGRTSPFVYTIKAEVVQEYKEPVIENEPPEIKPPSNVVLLPKNADMNKIKENTKATANDKEDGDLTSKIVYGEISTSNTGIVIIPTTVTDSGNLSDDKDIPASVIDFINKIDKPVEEIKPDDVVSGLDPSFDTEIKDNKDNTITVIVKDKNGNEEIGIVDIIKNNEDNKPLNTPPVISAPDEVILIPKGADTLTIKKNTGATANDKEDGNLTNKIIYGPLDTSTTGEKNLDLTVEDLEKAKDNKLVKTSVVNIPDSIIIGKNPSEITEKDIEIEGNHPDFKVTITDNENGTIHVKVEDKLGNNTEKNVTVINYGISTVGNNVLLEKDIKNAESVIISQTKAKAIDEDGKELTIKIEGLNLNEIGASQKIILTAQGKTQKFTREINAYVVNIIEEVHANNNGTTEQDGKSLTEGYASDFKLTPEAKSKYKVNDKIKVTVEDTYGNKVEDYVNVIGKNNNGSGDNSNTQEPTLLIDEDHALLEHDDDEPKKTILEQTDAIGKNSDGSKAELKVSTPKMNKIGETQTVIISFKDKDTDEYIEEEIKVVVVDIIEELEVPEDTTMEDLEDWDTEELVDGTLSTMKLSHKVINKNKIQVTVKDKYGNSVKDNVKVIYKDKSYNNKKENGIPVIESKNGTIVKQNTSYQDVFNRLNIYAHDDEDGNLTNKVIMENYNPNQLGNQNIILKVSDSDGNKVNKNVIVEVVAFNDGNVNGSDSDDTIIQDETSVTIIDGKSQDSVIFTIPKEDTEIEIPEDTNKDIPNNNVPDDNNNNDKPLVNENNNMPNILPKTGVLDNAATMQGIGVLGLLTGILSKIRQSKIQKTRIYKRKKLIK